MSLLPFPSSSLYMFFSVTCCTLLGADQQSDTHILWLLPYIYAVTDTQPQEWEQTVPEKMTFKWFLQDMDIIDSTATTHPSSPLSLSSPTKVQELWLSPSPPTVSFYHPKALNHIIVVMWKSCCSNYGSVLYFNFRTECSCLSKGKKEIQWPLGFYMKLFQNPVG